MRRAYSYVGAEVLGKTLHSVILTLTRLVFARRRRRRGFDFPIRVFMMMMMMMMMIIRSRRGMRWIG